MLFRSSRYLVVFPLSTKPKRVDADTTIQEEPPWEAKRGSSYYTDLGQSGI